MGNKEEGELMKEYKIIKNVLNYREDGEEWIPFTIEELSTILTDKVVSQQMINDTYLESVKKLLDPLMEAISQPTDMRYDIAKAALNGVIQIYNDNVEVEEVLQTSFKYADAFIKEYKKGE